MVAFDDGHQVLLCFVLVLEQECVHIAGEIVDDYLKSLVAQSVCMADNAKIGVQCLSSGNGSGVRPMNRRDPFHLCGEATGTAALNSMGIGECEADSIECQVSNEHG